MSDRMLSVLRTHDDRLVPPAGVYELDGAHTSVEFVARHLMITKVRGRFTDVRGQITITEEPEGSHVEVEMRAILAGREVVGKSADGQVAGRRAGCVSRPATRCSVQPGLDGVHGAGNMRGPGRRSLRVPAGNVARTALCVGGHEVPCAGRCLTSLIRDSHRR